MNSRRASLLISNAQFRCCDAFVHRFDAPNSSRQASCLACRDAPAASDKSTSGIELPQRDQAEQVNPSLVAGVKAMRFSAEGVLGHHGWTERQADALTAPHVAVQKAHRSAVSINIRFKLYMLCGFFR
jgi:hypothetical protein